MMPSKIQPLHKWGATACLTAARDEIPNDEQVLVLSYNEDHQSYMMSANMNHAQALWLVEHIKQQILSGTT